MEAYSFRQCKLTMLDKLFGLRQTFSSTVLDQWLTTEIVLTDREKSSLEDLQMILNLNAQGWNEQELSMHFIGPLFNLVGFTEPYQFNLFAQRKIGTIIKGINGEIELSGEPDGIIATGYREPEVPMFAFSEYKRELDPDGDPAGQALAAMLTGQALNGNQHPVYGAYIVGSIWHFIVLDGQYYTFSGNYSALDSEIFDIFRILKNLKQTVITLTTS